MKMNERIKTRRKSLKLTQATVAASVNVSRVSVTQWELGDTSPKGENLLSLADTLNCTPNWILHGGSADSNVLSPFYVPKSNNVPLISWVQAGSWGEIVDNFQPGDADEYYPCPEKHSEGTFALTVVGESMYPDFIPGEIIYVDPCVEAVSGSCVVVRQNGDTEATFKQFMLDGSKKYLKALNPNWPNPITDMLPDAAICGVVIGSYRKR